MIRKGMSIKTGFTLIEVLIVFILLIYISPLFLKVLEYMQNYPNQSTQRQNFIGLLQLRRSLSLGVNHIIEDDSICMTYKDDLMCFEEYENNLIAFPGTQYFLVNVSDITFEVKDDWLTIYYFSLNKDYFVKLIKI